jgi:succinoglycan biosynthesis protein ExoW
LSTVAVVIPFFQRKEGLLSRALESICLQNIAVPITVLVVDDESPVDPASEVPASLPAHVSVQIIRQKNAGPGAARNAGLEHAPSATQYVAFLDSDDQWLPNHLRNAIDALGDSCDLYFANHYEPESTVDEFLRRNLIVLAQHRRLERGVNCFEFSGDMRDQIIRANIIETSTVVYRWSPLKQVRFKPEYRNAFEDHLFWLDIARAARGIAFSAEVECQYGRGVSIWRSGGFGSEYALPKIIDQLRFIGALKNAASTTAAQTESLRNIKANVRMAFVAEILNRTRRRAHMDWSSIAKIIKLDPALLVLCAPLALQVAAKRKKALSQP